jgi:hypothetical protein
MNHLKELSFFLPELVIFVAWLYTWYQLFISIGVWSWKRVALYVYGAACIYGLWIMSYQ